ncbi:MAG: hypothetical protein AAB624_01630 [Patescibacteria group bacterium]
MSENKRRNYIPFTDAEERLERAIIEKRIRVSQRFPLWTTLTATFGVVAIFYGLEKLIDKVPLLSNNPWILLVVGVLTLIVTGTTYQKL